MCGPGCDWCHHVSVRMPARYTGNKSIPCCTNNTIPFEHSSSQLQGAWKVFFLWEVFHDIISDVHAAKLFMNNVHNALFTLITETAFENSWFYSEGSFQLLHCPKASSIGFLLGKQCKHSLGGFWMILPTCSLDTSPQTLFCLELLQTSYEKFIHSQKCGWFWPVSSMNKCRVWTTVFSSI